MKKRILIFYDHFYPAYKAGGPVQSIVNMIRQLHNVYDFYVICKPNEMNEKSVLAGIQVNKWNNWEGKAQVYYWDYSFVNRKDLKLIADAIQPSFIFINGIFSFFFNILPLQLFSGKKYPVVLSSRGMLHKGALSQKRIKKEAFLYYFKLIGWHKNVRWHATDELEEKFVQQKFGKNVSVNIAANFPNLIDAEPYPPKKEGELIMGTIALISPMKNHEEVIKVLMTCSKKINWHIYGPVKDNNYWQQCLSMINQLPSNITVHIHGDLPPAQLANAMRTFQLFIMPSKSENFGHAILEALSAARPVITTDTTPFKNLMNYSAGSTVSIENLHTELKAAIDLFADMSQKEFETHSAGASDYARGFVSIENLKEKYHQLFTTA